MVWLAQKALAVGTRSKVLGQVSAELARTSQLRLLATPGTLKVACGARR